MSDVDTLAVVDTINSSGGDLSASAEHTHVDDHGQLQRAPLMEPPNLTGLRARAVAAKLSLPHMGFVLSRPRLTALLEPVRGGGLVYLCAAPGYGKTAFIVDQLSSANGGGLYFSVDEADMDPIRFLTYLMAGLGVGPVEEIETETLGWSVPGGVDQSALDLAAQLVDFMSQRAGEPTLLAVDDFHLADSSSQVTGVLGLIVRALPPAWTLVVSSRRPIPLRLSGLSLGGRFVQLGTRELRLTPGELRMWAAHNWGVELEAADASALWRVTQGWPAALVLLGRRLISGRTAISRREIQQVIAQGRDLGEYLEQGILSEMDESVAEIMLAAGLLPRAVFPRDEMFFPGPPGQAEAALEELVSRGYFVAGAGQRTYVVHPLLQAFARQQVWKSADREKLVDRTAAHLERIGECHQAISLYLQAGRFEDAARLLRSLFLASFGKAAGVTRGDWLRWLPEDFSNDDGAEPWLIAAKARILQEQADYEQASMYYERAARLLAERGDREGLLPVLLGSAFSLFNQGRWEESLAVMKRCRLLAASPRAKVEVLVVEGGVLVGLCRWDEAVENWEKALALTPSTSRDALARRIYLHRARLFYSLGHYPVANLWVEKAIRDGNRPGSPGYALALNGAAIIAGLTGDYDRAGQLAEECSRLVHTRGYSVIEIPTLLNQATVALGKWDYRSAIVKIKEAQALAAKTGDAEECYWAESMLGDLCRRNNNARRALEHHRLALDIVCRNRLAIFERVQASAAVGMDLAVLGEEVEALTSLEEAAGASRRWGLFGSLAPALFYLGWLYARSGREHEAARSLSEAIHIAEEHDHVHFFCQEAKIAVPILALCHRFGTGAFIPEKIVSRLPLRLQTYFRELAEGKIYPTDVSLGWPRRKMVAAQATSLAQGNEVAANVAAGMESLTDREREVLKMVSLGMPNKVIGAKLYISEKTVKTHTNHIFRKLGVANRLQATLAFQSYQRANVVSTNAQRGRNC